VEDRQRRKDRNKRRVSFKPSQFPHNKKDIKLRPEDLRRWDEDDDMSDMTTTVRVSTTPLAPSPNTKPPTNVIPFRL